MFRQLLQVILLLGALLLAVPACKTYYFRENYRDANALLHATGNLMEKPYLKAHLKNGDICILRDSWSIDTASNTVTGTGSFYNFNRELVNDGIFTIPVDSVAIFETNTRLPNPEAGRITTLSILAGVEVLLGVICVTVPKACWGSCPTFYLDGHDNFHYANAEAFTNAISPSMEYTDEDALGNYYSENGSFAITMKNEALETHCVNNVQLLAFPLNDGEHVLQTPAGTFLSCGNADPPTSATGDEGNITALVQAGDMTERFSLADERNLCSRESVYLTFSNTGMQHPGLILHFRQTLMNTYLFYNAFGYMGDMAGDVFAMIENREDIRNNFDAISRTLGNIEVFTWNDDADTWKYEGEFSETGPIAINRQIIALDKMPQNGEDLRVKLVMNKGLWRIDQASLADIRTEAVPLVINPISILSKGKPDAQALASLGKSGKYLVSMPGSEYRFNFVLPEENRNYELFISATGYYLEWMRRHWLKDKNLVKLKQMLYNPETYLRNETRQYKQYESVMEELFWNSRIDTKNFVYHEN